MDIKFKDRDLRIADKMLARGDYKAAHSKAMAMIKANPHNPAGLFICARIASAHKNQSKALGLFAKAAQLSEANPSADTACYIVMLARQQLLRGQTVAAKTVIDRIASYKITNAHLADNVGVIYNRAGYHDLAIGYFDQAIALDDRPANFHLNLALNLQFLGSFEQAKSAFEATLARDRNNARAYLSLIGLKGFEPSADFEANLSALCERAQSRNLSIDLSSNQGKSDDVYTQACHAMAKLRESQERYGESLPWLARAKAPARTAAGYDVTHDLENFKAAAKTARTVTPLGIEPDIEHSDAAPIFITGLPRTGTTLIDRIISSHPDVTSAGELNIFAALVRQSVSSADPGVLSPDILAKAQNLDLAKIGKSYIAQTQELRRGAARMSDKMPFNFFHAGLIHRALPSARIIALRRGAMDSCLSNYRQLFSDKSPYYNYALDLVNCAQFYKGYDGLMTQWREQLPNERFMEVRYEDVIKDQEGQTRRLLEFCGLDWNPACLNFHENAAPVSTASSVQVRQPLYASSDGRWKKYGDSLSTLYDALGPLAET